MTSTDKNIVERSSIATAVREYINSLDSEKINVLSAYIGENVIDVLNAYIDCVEIVPYCDDRLTFRVNNLAMYNGKNLSSLIQLLTYGPILSTGMRYDVVTELNNIIIEKFKEAKIKFMMEDEALIKLSTILERVVTDNWAETIIALNVLEEANNGY